MEKTSSRQRNLIAIMADDDTLNGFALTGIQIAKDIQNFLLVNHETTREELERHAQVLGNRSDVAVVFVAEFAYKKIKGWIRDYNHVVPCFLELPSRLGPAWKQEA